MYLMIEYHFSYSLLETIEFDRQYYAYYVDEHADFFLYMLF